MGVDSLTEFGVPYWSYAGSERRFSSDPVPTDEHFWTFHDFSNIVVSEEQASLEPSSIPAQLLQILYLNRNSKPVVNAAPPGLRLLAVVVHAGSVHRELSSLPSTGTIFAGLDVALMNGRLSWRNLLLARLALGDSVGSVQI
jgi:hypothetical protein